MNIIYLLSLGLKYFRVYFELVLLTNCLVPACFFWKYDIEKTEREFRRMIQWRSENNMDGFVKKNGVPHEVFQYAAAGPLRGLDRDGDPIQLLRYGAVDAIGFFDRFSAKELHYFTLFQNELSLTRDHPYIRDDWKWQIHHYEPMAGRRLRHFMVVADMQGIHRGLFRPQIFSLLKQFARGAQDYYPGYAKRVIVIRAPNLFKIAWKVAKHFYDPVVHEKIIFTNDDNYLDISEKHIDLKVLPSLSVQSMVTVRECTDIGKELSMKAESCQRIWSSTKNSSLLFSQPTRLFHHDFALYSILYLWIRSAHCSFLPTMRSFGSLLSPSLRSGSCSLCSRGWVQNKK